MFKKGDKVVVIREEPPQLNLGDEFEIADDQGNEKFVNIVFRNGKGWLADRFKLVEEPVMAKREYQPGDLVRIIHNNEGRAGGVVAVLGRPEIWGKNKEVVLVSKHDRHSMGYCWQMKDWKWVYAEKSFELVRAVDAPKEAEMRTYKQLYVEAAKRGIPRRSAMNKAQLFAALQQKQVKAADPVPKPVPPPPPPKKTLGEELREKTGNLPRTCSYAHSYKGIRRFQVSDVCHARMRAAQMDEAVCDVAGHMGEHKNQAGYRRFLQFMLNSSPYASVYLTKNVDEALKSGVYMDCTKSHSQMVAGCIALREGSEFPKRIDVFAKLLDVGFSGKVAWFAANFFSLSGEHFQAIGCGGGHMTLHSGMSADDLLKFFKEGFHRAVNAPSNVNANHYYIFNSIAQISEQGSINTWLNKRGFSPVEAPRWGEKPAVFSVRQLSKLLEELEVAFA